MNSVNSIPEELNNEVTQLKEMHTKLISNVISISKLEDYDDYFEREDSHVEEKQSQS